MLLVADHVSPCGWVSITVATLADEAQIMGNGTTSSTVGGPHPTELTHKRPKIGPIPRPKLQIVGVNVHSPSTFISCGRVSIIVATLADKAQIVE